MLAKGKLPVVVRDIRGTLLVLSALTSTGGQPLALTRVDSAANVNGSNYYRVLSAVVTSNCIRHISRSGKCVLNPTAFYLSHCNGCKSRLITLYRPIVR